MSNLAMNICYFHVTSLGMNAPSKTGNGKGITRGGKKKKRLWTSSEHKKLVDSLLNLAIHNIREVIVEHTKVVTCSNWRSGCWKRFL